MIYTVAFLAILVIYHGVAEIVHMAACFPYGRVHEDSGVYAHNIIVHLGHTAPPVVAYISFKFSAKLPIIIHRAKAIIYLTRLKNESILFAVRYNILQLIIICHNGGKNRQKPLTD